MINDQSPVPVPLPAHPPAASTRFGPPKLSSDQTLVRKALLSSGRGVAELRLTLCISPAGYGKTTLLSQWQRSLQAEGINALWMSLTPVDADALSLLATLESGVRHLLGSGSLLDESLGGVAPLRAGAPLFMRPLQRLLAGLAMLDAPLVFFFDNYHEIDNDEVAAVFNELLLHASPQCHFVIASRTEPAFRYSALLINGRAQLFDVDDLKLDALESAQFIVRNVAGVPLADEDVRLIYEKTEGWPIAMQLCCLLVNRQKSALFLRDFSGRDVDLGHFLNEQVFRLLDPELQKFAAQLALFDNFCAELADAALQRSNSALLITDLIRQKLFIYSLDRNAVWFRFHQMFREFLRGTQWRPGAGEEASIMTAAAQWSRLHARHVDAIDYAVRAKNYGLARTLMIASAQTIVRDEGLLPNLLQWSQKIPVEDTAESVDLRYWTSWSLAFSCRYLEAEKEIRLLEKSLAESANLSRQQLAGYRANIGSLKVAIKTFQDKSLTVYHASAQWLAKYRKTADPFHVGVAAGARFISARLQLEVVEAKKALDLAKTVITNANSLYGRLWIITLDSLGQMEFGDFRIAQQTLLAGYRTTVSSSNHDSVIHSTMALLLAKVVYEQGDSEQAQRYLREGYRHIMDHGLIETAAAGLEVRCYSDAERDLDATMAELQKAEFLVGHYPQRLRFILRQLRFNLLLNAGKFDLATREAELMAIGADGFSEVDGEESNPLVFQQKQVVVAKLLLQEKRWDQARELLEQLLAVPSTAQRPRFHVELLILDACAQIQSGQVQAGCRVAMKAAVIAQQNGLFRVFPENRCFAAPVVRELAQRRALATSSADDVWFERLFAALGARASAGVEAEWSPLEPLTRRERELLRLLDTGLTVQALADHLFVSKATVKWHLYNLYGKLRVKSRAAALALARKQQLL